MGEEFGLSVVESSTELPCLCRYLSECSPLALVAVEGVRHVVSYLNPAFVRLAGKEAGEVIGRSFIEVVPVGEGNQCLQLLDRVLRTGVAEGPADLEHRQTPSGGSTATVYWTYTAWAILGADDHPVGVMVQVTDSTEAAIFRRQAAAMNEALVVSSVRQHEVTGATEALNAGLREARDRLEERVAERTAELARLNRALTAEVAGHRRAEAARLEMLQRLATAQEAKRHHLARDLHDQMGQLLTALGLGLKSLRDTMPESSAAAANLLKMQQLTDLIGREVHQIALELRPTTLDDLGLHTALANYVESWSEQSGVEAEFQGAGAYESRLPLAVETALYRVVQEALTNVRKHARSRHVSVILQRAPQEVLAVIEDDGVGFNLEAPAAGRLGLLGMRERLALVRGTLVVESTPDKGTAVFARVPLGAGQRCTDG